MTEVLGRIRTADGYVFYHLADDSIVDSLDPSSVDMSWASLRQFANMAGGLGIGYEFEDGSRVVFNGPDVECIAPPSDDASRYAYDKEQPMYKIINDAYGDPVEVTLHEVQQQIENWRSDSVTLAFPTKFDGIFAIIDGDEIVELHNDDPHHRIVIAIREQCRYAYDKEQHDNERQNGEHEESI